MCSAVGWTCCVSAILEQSAASATERLLPRGNCGTSRRPVSVRPSVRPFTLVYYIQIAIKLFSQPGSNIYLVFLKSERCNTVPKGNPLGVLNKCGMG